MGDELIVEKQIAKTKRRRAKFFQRRGSLWARIATPGGAAKAVWVASEFRVVGLGQISATKGWCAVIEFYDPNGYEQRWHVPFSQLVCHSRKAIEVLTHNGLMVRPGKLGRELFCEYLVSAARRVDTRFKILTGLPSGPVFKVIFEANIRRARAVSVEEESA